jgi:hypothetical protein
LIEIEQKVCIPLLLYLNPVCSGKCTGIAYVDSTKIQVFHNKRIKRNKVFRGMAETGKSTAGRFSGFNLHLIGNEKGELVNFCLTGGHVDDRNANVFNVLIRKLSGKPDGDKGYISSALFETLFNDGVHMVTGIGSNMKNRLMSFRDRILPGKRSVIETIHDGLKNSCHMEHSRHGSTHNFLINLLSGLATSCFFPGNPSTVFDMEHSTLPGLFW